MSESRRRFRRALVGYIVIPIGLAFIFAIKTAYDSFDFIQASADLPHQASRARALGVPWTLAELSPPHAWPESANALPQIQVLTESKLPAEQAGSVSAYDSPVPLAPDKKFVEAWGSKLDLAHAVGDKSHLDMKLNFDDPGVLYRHLPTIKGIVKVLAAEAVVHASQGDTTGTIQALERAKRVSLMPTDSTATLIGGLVEIASLAIVDKAVSNVACLWSHDGARLSRLREFSKASPAPPDFDSMMRAECYVGMTFARHLGPGLVDPQAFGGEQSGPIQRPFLAQLNGRPGPDGYPGSLTARGYMSRTLKEWCDLFDAANGKGLKGWREAEQAQAAKYNDPKAGLPHSYDLAQVTTPVLYQAATAVQRCAGQSKLSDAYVGLLQWKLAHGSFPASLDGTGLAFVDAVDGQPVGYRREGSGFIIWIAGTDGKRHGGKTSFTASHSSSTSQGYDTSLIYPRHLVTAAEMASPSSRP